jgi:hypothetical protein
MPAKKTSADKTNGNSKRHATQQSVNGAVKSICDIMRRSNVAGAMNYVHELTNESVDTRTPAQLLDFIAQKGREADAALARLHALIA